MTFHTFLRRGMNAVFCQFVRDHPCAFPFSPQGKDFFPEREQRCAYFYMSETDSLAMTDRLSFVLYEAGCPCGCLQP